MASTTNTGTAIGRLGADPTVFVNADGSKALRLSIYADRGYKNATTGERESDRINLEAWVRAETNGIGIFGHMHRGDLIAVTYSVRSGQYADKQTGEVIFTQSLRVEDVSLLEPLTTTSMRLAQRLGAAQPEQHAPTQPGASNRRRKAAAAA